MVGVAVVGPSEAAHAVFIPPIIIGCGPILCAPAPIPIILFPPPPPPQQPPVGVCTPAGCSGQPPPPPTGNCPATDPACPQPPPVVIILPPPPGVTTTLAPPPPPTTTSTTAAPGAPSLQVLPADGPPGFVTNAVGHNFAPHDVVVLTWSQGIGTMLVPTDATGSFSVGVLVFDHDLLGPRNLVATDHLITAQAAFLVVPGDAQPHRYVGPIGRR